MAYHSSLTSDRNDLMTKRDLIESITGRDAAKLRKCVADKVDIQSSDNGTPLYKCCQARWLEGVTILIDAGVDKEKGTNSNTTTSDNTTPLFACVQGQWVDGVKTLLKAGVNPNHGLFGSSAGGYVKSPLFYCVEETWVVGVELLLDSGADPQNGTAQFRNDPATGSPLTLQETPLHMAAKKSHVPQMAKLLFAKGAFPVLNVDKRMPMDFLSNAEIKAIFEEAKLAAEKAGKPWQLPAMTKRDLEEALRERNVSKLEQCIKDKVDIHYSDNGTPLYKACFSRWLEGVNILLAAGADKQKGTNANITSSDNESPLFRCCQGQWADGVKVLLKAGADPNLGLNGSSAGGYIKSPLYWCIEEPWVVGVELLLDGGADPQKGLAQFKPEPTPQETPLHAAAKKGHLPQIAKLLFSKGAFPVLNADKRMPMDYLQSPEIKAIFEEAKLAAEKAGKPWVLQSMTRRDLEEALREKNLQKLEQCVKDKVDIHFSDNGTPLYKACYSRWLEGVNVLLAAGADKQKGTNANVTSSDNETPLFRCCQGQWAEGVKVLLKAGADPNMGLNGSSAGGYIKSPLYWCIEEPWVVGAELLLDGGADPQKGLAQFKPEPTPQETPLHAAAKKGHLPQIAKLLFAKGAFPVLNADKRMPMDYLQSPEIKAIFEEAKLVAEKAGKPWVLQSMTRRDLEEAVRERNADKLRQCVKDKVDIHFSDNGTPFYKACYSRWLDGVNILIEAGADLHKGTNANVTSSDNESPLFRCCQGQWAEGVKILLKAGADPNLGLNGSSAGGYIKSPLYWCIEEPWVVGVELLLDGGADPQKGLSQFKPEPTPQETPLHAAAKKGHLPQIAKLLFSKGAFPVLNADKRMPMDYLQSPEIKAIFEEAKLAAEKAGKPWVLQSMTRRDLEEALREKNLQKLEQCVKDKVDIHFSDNGTPLYKACYSRWLEGVNVLLAAGADKQKGTNANVTSSDNETPLFRCCQGQWVDGVKTLLKAGADPNLGLNGSSAGGYIKSPLYWCIEEGWVVGAELLLDAGANPQKGLDQFRQDPVTGAPTTLQDTPLHVAAKKGHIPQFCKLLFAKGAFPVINADKRMPMEFLSSPETKSMFEEAKLAAEKAGKPWQLPAMTKRDLEEALRERNADKLRQCIKDKVDFHYSDNGTPFYKACYSRWVDGVNILIEAGADLNKGTNANVTSTDNESPLFRCCQGQWAEGVKILLKAGADINLGLNGSSAGGYYKSPVFWCIEENWVDGAKLLIESGCDVNKGMGQFKDGGASSVMHLTPLHMACKKQSVPILQLLLQKGAHVVKDNDARYPDHYLWDAGAKAAWETEKAKASGSFYKQ